MKKIMVIAGARPNFMKIAPLMRAFKEHSDYFQVTLVHTGQHYDIQMSDVFFRELRIPKPHISLEVGSASHATQAAKIMLAFEKVLLRKKPDLIVVVGDVNSTMACSLVAAKMNVQIAHVEAGLRSGDREMPEEINRIVTDSLSDYLFVSEESGLCHLKKEGVSASKVFYVGNIMIDTLLSNMPSISKSKALATYGLQSKNYSVLTLHRPGNVDSKKALEEIYEILRVVSAKIKIVYSLHPRTRKMIDQHDFTKRFESLDDLDMIDPLGYIDFMKLVKESRFVLTDSGGIQEETTVLGVPCLTMRENTERPITIKQGTNILVGRSQLKITKEINKILNDCSKKGGLPKYWDGKTAQRIVKILREHRASN
jgi:UDP-N-acetylglucosamine 2-epimerase (non-hydrolysing)